MFTGIVEATGTVRSALRQGDVMRAWIACPFAAELHAGASVAVSGCCLTAAEVSADAFRCDLHQETLDRTAFDRRLVPGALVNLERPMRADGRFDGHIVQGHVDGVGIVRELSWLGESARLLVAPPPELARYLVHKGSIAVDGVSLTIAALRADVFEIALIPFTLQVTSLREAGPGSLVNLEADVVAKYVERLLGVGAAAGRQDG